MPRTALLILLVTSTLHAQFPATMGGVFSLLQQKPSIVRVVSLTHGSSSFKLSLRADDGSTSTHESIGAGELEMKLIEHLQEGRRYAFPQHLIDLFGYDNTVAIVRSLPSPTPPPFPFPKSTPAPGLLSLGREHPFRAIVLDQGLGEKGYSIVLQAADTRLLHLSGTFDNEFTKRIALHLKRGETFEFPAVLDDALLNEADRKARSQPKTAEVRALGRYIGEWSGTLESDPLARVVMKCHWKADGTGIWREITFSRQDDDNPPALDIALITYDAAQQHYIAADPSKPGATPFHITWKAAERSFITTLSSTPDETRVNTATFSSDDRIDWETVVQKAAGKVVSTSRGSYRRTAAVASTLKLPPATQTTTITSPTQMVTTASGATQSTSSFTTSAIVHNDQPQERTLLQLRELPPFRGKITALNIGPDFINLTIDCGDGRKYLIHHKRDDHWDTNLAIAKRLKYDETFEFPDVLTADYTAPSGEVKPTEAMRALEPFIGEWRVFWDSGPLKGGPVKGLLRYFWKNDGSGLWREFVMPATTLEQNGAQVSYPARTMTYLITYDAAKGHYVEHVSSPLALPAHYTATWDASGQVWSQKAESPHPKPGTQINGIRRFVSPDRIDYILKHTQADGTPTDEASGHYERIKH